MSAAWVRDPLKNINKQETGTSMTGWAAQWWQQSGGTEENTAVLIGAVLKQAAHYLHNRALKDRRTDLAKSLREGLAQCEGDCTTSACMDGVQAKDLACSSTQNCKIKMKRKKKAWWISGAHSLADGVQHAWSGHAHDFHSLYLGPVLHHSQMRWAWIVPKRRRRRRGLW